MPNTCYMQVIRVELQSKQRSTAIPQAHQRFVNGVHLCLLMVTGFVCAACPDMPSRRRLKRDAVLQAELSYKSSYTAHRMPCSF